MTLLEEIADVQHEIWSHWMKYMFEVSKQNADGSVTIPAEKVERWRRQMATPYGALDDKERESDREQAEKVINRLQDLGKAT